MIVGKIGLQIGENSRVGANEDNGHVNVWVSEKAYGDYWPQSMAHMNKEEYEQFLIFLHAAAKEAGFEVA